MSVKENNIFFIPAIQTVGLIVATIIVSLIALKGMNTFQELKAQDLKNQAFRDCGAISQFTYEQTSKEGKTTRSTEPNKGVYKTCIEDKGYRTSVAVQ